MRRPFARTVALALTCAALAAAVSGAPAVARAATLTVSEFATRLEQAQALVSGEKGALETTAAAVALADRIDGLLPVSVGVREGTRTIEVDLSGVTASVRGMRQAGTTAERRTAAEDLDTRLVALRSAVGSESATAAADPTDPAALAELVAAQPRTTNTLQDWLNAQIEKFLNWLGGLLSRLGPSGPAPATGANRATMLLVLAVPVLLALIVLTRALLARRRRAAAGRAPEQSVTAGGPAVAAAADLPVDALGHARRLAAAGAHRDAVRALYGGAARHLVEAGAVTRMRTRTSLEMLRDVAAAAPALAGPFESLTGDFERAWYGHADPGGAGFEHARVAYERVVARASRPAASPASPPATSPAPPAPPAAPAGAAPPAAPPSGGGEPL
jgi:hypothetical protein